MSLTEEYFKYQTENMKKFGERTIVFMMVGSFYEAYETNDKGFNLLEI